MTECDPAHLYAAWYQNSELSSCHEDMCMTAIIWHIPPSYLILALVLDSPILEGKASHHLHLGTPALWLMSAESIICEIPGTDILRSWLAKNHKQAKIGMRIFSSNCPAELSNPFL